MSSEQSNQRPTRRTGMFPKIQMKSARRFIVPAMTAGLLITVLLMFRTVLLPFIFACIIVYLMEPVVRRMTRASPLFKHGAPRWLAVILVYIGFLTIVTTTILFVVPRFVAEIVRFAETTPEVIQEFRQEQLPGYNQRLQGFLKSYVPESVQFSEELSSITTAQSRVQQARIEATNNVVQFTSPHENVREDAVWGHLLYVDDGFEPAPQPNTGYHAALTGGWDLADSETQPTFRIVPDGSGGFDVFLSDEALEIKRLDNDGWTLRRHIAVSDDQQTMSVDAVNRTMFDLERGFDDFLDGLTSSTSTLSVGATVEFAQTLMLRFIDIFLAIVLTLMIAAFISIDLSRFRHFVRSMLPDEYEADYLELVRRFDVGLSGVVRGQLMICLVNAILVYIGLAFIGVKYSLLLAVFAGFMSIIPIFGSILSSIPIVAIGLTQGLTTGLLVLAWLLSINFAEANFLNPKIIGTAAHIHPVIVIFALLAGQSAFGLVGAILALPVTSIVLAIFGFVRDKYTQRNESLQTQQEG